jgi:hypothetical protein
LIDNIELVDKLLIDNIEFVDKLLIDNVELVDKLLIDNVELVDKLFKLVVNAYTDSVDILDEIVVVVSCVESS